MKALGLSISRSSDTNWKVKSITEKNRKKKWNSMSLEFILIQTPRLKNHVAPWGNRH